MRVTRAFPEKLPDVHIVVTHEEAQALYEALSGDRSVTRPRNRAIGDLWEGLYGLGFRIPR